ncbi:MAG: hypothetical protein K0Q57_1128 [Gammaproteobacteria bacterium]|jgi:hypothetical protein|nr:hypothetical protein [Gammaproteobacteria bacterium]
MPDFTYALANSPQEINEFYQLVREVYILEKGYNIEIPDSYTENSEHYTLRNSGKVVAGFRISRGWDKCDFPSGESEQLNLDPHHRYAEISRWAIHSDYRRKISIIKTFKDFALYAKKHDITHFIAKVTLDLVAFYEHYGLYKIGQPIYDSKPFANLNEPNNSSPNFQFMLLPAKVLYQRYLQQEIH